jgi:hypothetical protein
MAAGMLMTERETFEPVGLVSHHVLSSIYNKHRSSICYCLPSRYTLPVMPTACAMTTPMGVFCVSRLSIVLV